MWSITTHVLIRNEDLWHDIIYTPRERTRVPKYNPTFTAKIIGAILWQYLNSMSWGSESINSHNYPFVEALWQCLFSFIKLCNSFQLAQIINPLSILTVEAVIHPKLNTFVAATKQPYEWLSPSVCPSICPSACHTSFTMFPSSYHHEIFSSDYQWQKWCSYKRTRSELKGRGHRGQNRI